MPLESAETPRPSGAPPARATGSLRVLITAGPTHEPIDEVRYLANRSSGRMGIALAEAAARQGHAVTLLLGPTPHTPDSTEIRVERFQTTADLERLLAECWPSHDLLIMAAAVADYRMPRDDRSAKIERSADGLTLHLESTPDLVGGLRSVTRADQLVIGFALEPRDRLDGSARAKLERKSLDGIVGNPIETMESDSIDGRLYLRTDGDPAVIEPGGSMTKAAFAAWLMERVGALAADRSG